MNESELNKFIAKTCAKARADVLKDLSPQKPKRKKAVTSRRKLVCPTLQEAIDRIFGTEAAK